MTHDEALAHQWQWYEKKRMCESERECKAIMSFVATCEELGVKPHVPRMHAMLKACGLPSIPRQRLKELLADYLR
jgi:hypothetical protein